MELRQLRYFMEVAEREHVSEAALHLHIAQSAISRQIANLEDELEVQLFERTGRNVKLTPIGKTFFYHTKIAMKAIDHAKKQVDEYIDPERGSIKIGFPTSLASNLLPNVLAVFKKKYPNISFHLRQGSYNFLIEAVKSREIDVAFLGPVPIDDPDIVGDVLFSEDLYALVPNDHLMASRKSIYLTELKDDPFVLFPKGYIFEKLATDGCRQAGFEPNVTSEGEDLDAIKGLVAAGMGITLLPESAFSEVNTTFTSKIAISNPQLHRTVGIITPKHRNLAPSETVFYQFILNHFKNLD